MKRTVLVLALISVLLFLVVGVFFVNQVGGNAVFPSGSIRIEVTQPVYYSSTITLSYLAKFPMSLSHKWIVYSLDGGGNVSVYDEYNDLGAYFGKVTLSGLSSGQHTIDICSKNGTFVWGTTSIEDWYYCDAHDRESFTIDLSRKSPAPTPSEEAGVQNASQFMVIGGAVALVSIIIFLGLQIYFIKRK